MQIVLSKHHVMDFSCATKIQIISHVSIKMLRNLFAFTIV